MEFKEALRKIFYLVGVVLMYVIIVGLLFAAVMAISMLPKQPTVDPAPLNWVLESDDGQVYYPSDYEESDTSDSDNSWFFDTSSDTSSWDYSWESDSSSWDSWDSDSSSWDYDSSWDSGSDWGSDSGSWDSDW